jgi:hypothetical protein
MLSHVVETLDIRGSRGLAVTDDRIGTFFGIVYFYRGIFDL